MHSIIIIIIIIIIILKWLAYYKVCSEAVVHEFIRLVYFIVFTIK